MSMCLCLFIVMELRSKEEEKNAIGFHETGFIAIVLPGLASNEWNIFDVIE